MRAMVSSLHGANLSIATFLKQPTPWNSGVLGALCFSADAAKSQVADSGVPCLHVPMQSLDGADAACEVWRNSNALMQGQCDGVHYCHDDEVLFGVIALSEDMFEARADKTPLQQAAESAYSQVFALLDTLRFPYLFRFWNYFADINILSFGLERYRQFNLGRRDAFIAHGRDIAGNFPAACALGAAQGPLNIAFLAGRVAPLRIENPRQISAYRYPRQYGPRSPMFSRASLVCLKEAAVLFISGTASIVGHTSLHASDVLAQTRETLANIKSVLAEANRSSMQSQRGGAEFNLADLNYRVYVRDPADLARVRHELQQCVGNALKAVYLKADVCRQDLLLEIEASAVQALVCAGGGQV